MRYVQQYLLVFDALQTTMNTFTYPPLISQLRAFSVKIFTIAIVIAISTINI